MKKYFIPICTIFLNVLFSQLPVDLYSNETYQETVTINSSAEYFLNIAMSSNTNWEEENNESAIMSLFINGEHNQDIVIYNGDVNHVYKQAIGYLYEGEHTIELFFDYNKSSLNAFIVHLDSIDLIDSNLIDVDLDVIKYSPILFGRDIFAWNESNHTDIPLLLFHSISYENGNKIITYSIIFSNEDSRVGIGLSDMMLSWGRTTDIEWVYQITLNNNGEIINEIFQGAGHTPTPFNGQKYGTHPYLINATANCNFSDVGTSEYKFFLNPTYIIEPNHTREYLMDENPWTYKIMGQELINENKYEEIQDPKHWELSDIRNYIYIEYTGNSSTYAESSIKVYLYNDCYKYSNNHNDEDISFNFSNGVQRTAIELPEAYDINELQKLIFSTEGLYQLNDIISIFYLSENYEPIYVEFTQPDYPLILNQDYPNIEILINENTLLYDCNSELYGTASCDECGICTGGNTGIEPGLDLDECGICFGNNQDMDCNGECFGNAYLDECSVCDNNPNNDGETCNAGCYDINAENYNPDATIFDNSCIYSDQVFYVPEEYEKIEYAIFFASSSDTVLVGPGTYYEEIDLLGKGINLISATGPYSTIIIANTDNDDGNGEILEPDESVITVRDVIDSHVTIDGFTLQGGYGKGVNFEYFISVASEPEMFNDMMYNYIKSGGISIINSSITLNNLIIQNNAAMNFGGGIGMVDSYVDLNNIIIENNNIPDIDALGGSGIAINGGITSIDNCIIRNNSVGLNFYQLNGGGGILCGFNFSGSPLELSVSNTEIYGNSANIGAGIGALSGNITLDRVLLFNNTGDYGSAISLGEPLGLVIDDINMTITNSTITDNSGELSCGMIDNSHIVIANSILWNESSTYEFTTLPNNSLLNVNAFYSDIRLLDNIEHSYSFDSNPLFTNQLNNDYTLSEESPCIDSGTDLLTFNNNTILDIDSSEYYGISPDIGYFEHFEGFLYGDVNSDLEIDILDIIILVNFIIDNQNNENYNSEAADMNQDGIINVIDIVAIINIIIT